MQQASLNFVSSVVQASQVVSCLQVIGVACAAIDVAVYCTRVLPVFDQHEFLQISYLHYQTLVAKTAGPYKTGYEA